MMNVVARRCAKFMLPSFGRFPWQIGVVTCSEHGYPRTFAQSSSVCCNEHQSTIHGKYRWMNICWAIVGMVISHTRHSSCQKEHNDAKVAADVSSLHHLDSEKTDKYDTAQWRIFTDRARELVNQHRYGDAQKVLEKALKHAEKGFGESDPHVASAKQNLAELYRLTKQYDKAAPLYDDALEILRNTYGPKDIRLAFALHNVAGFYMMQRKFTKAEEYYVQSLQVKLSSVGPGHTETGNTMFHLSEVYWAQHKYDKAADFASKALDIMNMQQANKTNIYLRRQLRTSEMFLRSNQAIKAKSILTEMLETLSPEDWNTYAETLESLSRVERALGCRHKQARSYIQSALRIREDKKNEYPNKYCRCLRLLVALNQDQMQLPSSTAEEILALEIESCKIAQDACLWAAASLESIIGDGKNTSGIAAHQTRLRAQHTALEAFQCMWVRCVDLSDCVSKNERIQCIKDMFHVLERQDVWPHPMPSNLTNVEFFESSPTEKKRVVLMATLLLHLRDVQDTNESIDGYDIPVFLQHQDFFSEGIPSWLPTVID